MKFRIITSLILLVVLGLAYLIYDANQPQQPPGPGSEDNGGIVLH